MKIVKITCSGSGSWWLFDDPWLLPDDALPIPFNNPFLKLPIKSKWPDPDRFDLAASSKSSILKSKFDGFGCEYVKATNGNIRKTR